MALPDNQLRQIIEAALMAVDEPMSLDRLGGIFLDHERPSPRRLRETLADIESVAKVVDFNCCKPPVVGDLSQRPRWLSLLDVYGKNRQENTRAPG